MSSFGLDWGRLVVRCRHYCSLTPIISLIQCLLSSFIFITPSLPHSDPSGKLNFASKAILHDKGVDFSNGQSFKINMDEMILEQELGKGNYGTVQRVFHKPTKVTMAMKVCTVYRVVI